MVQFMYYGNARAIESPELHRKKYWKLGPERKAGCIKIQLKKKSFYYKSNLNKARAAVLLARCQRSLLSYERYSAAELHAIAKELPFVTPNTHKLPHKQLAATLEAADEERLFTKFFDLLPEIRKHLHPHVPLVPPPPALHRLQLKIAIHEGNWSTEFAGKIDLRPSARSGHAPGILSHRIMYITSRIVEESEDMAAERAQRSQDLADSLQVLVNAILQRDGPRRLRVTDLEALRDAVAEVLPVLNSTSFY